MFRPLFATIALMCFLGLALCQTYLADVTAVSQAHQAADPAAVAAAAAAFAFQPAVAPAALPSGAVGNWASQPDSSSGLQPCKTYMAILRRCEDFCHTLPGCGGGAEDTGMLTLTYA